MKIIGILLILISLTIFISSFDKIVYDSYGNEILNGSGDIYATTDGVGVEYFLKNNLQFTSDQVLVVIILNPVIGILLLFILRKSKNFLRTKISKLNIILGAVLIILSVFLVINYEGSYSFFHNRIVLFATGFLSLVIFSISSQIWKIFPKNIFLLIVYFLTFLEFGFSIFIELGNHFEPFVHEGNWGQVDGNFITIFFDGIRHKWTLGYTLFRVSNIILFLISVYFISTAKSYITAKPNEMKNA